MNTITYNQYTHLMRKEKNSSALLRQSKSLDIDKLETSVLNHTNILIFGIAIIGGLITLILVRRFGANSFNLLYIAYVAQMALFPAIWAILHGERAFHSRASTAIACGLIAGIIATALGLTIIPWMGTWAPTIAFSTACIIHWPFKKYYNS